MEVKVISENPLELDVDALVVGYFEAASDLSGPVKAVDDALAGVITQLVSAGEINGKLTELTIVHTLGKIPAKKVMVVGLGKPDKLTLDAVRRSMGEACRLLRAKEDKRIACVGIGDQLGVEQVAQAITEGSILGLYEFNKYKTKEPDHGELEELLLIAGKKNTVAHFKQGCMKGRILAEAVCLARDMVNEPANYMTPTDMAMIAEKVASEHGLACEILDRDQMKELGMGALLGVAQGSQQPPKFIIIRYEGNPSSKKILGLVGKGITFDSGGISIKPSERMDEMKGDMAGAATVIAAICAIAQLKLKVNVTCLVPATENLPSGSALKPGDILKAMNGKTIEIANTDAEGRLILADALCYAQKLGLSPLIDVATLTGACRVALGDICTGVFGSDQDLVDGILNAGKETGELLWQMPMYEDYKELNKSAVADIKNTGGRWGGAITAAQFLAEFTSDKPWVHLDIAGTFMTDKKKGFQVNGGTGAVVRTLVNLVLHMADG